MSFVLLGILNSQAAGVGQAYFLSTLGGNGTEIGEAISVDSSDNFYTFGRTDSQGAGGDDFLIARYDSAGVIQFQRTLGSNFTDRDQGKGGTTDSLGNAYIVGFESAASADGALIAKYDSSGTIQWQRGLDNSSNDENARAAATDSNNNLYFVGDSEANNDAILIAKYNSAGAIQFQKVLGSGSGTNEGNAIHVDSSDNVYIAGSTRARGEGQDDVVIAKYDTSLNVQWQRVLGDISLDEGYGVSADSLGNVYVVGRTFLNNRFNLLLVKYNSAGVIQFQRTLSPASSTDDTAGFGISIGSDDSIYLVGQADVSGVEDYLIAKYDSSGTIQWQRVLKRGEFEAALGISLDSFDNLYVNGRSRKDNIFNQFLAKLPNDGSLEGTYSLGGDSVTYEASNFVSSTTTLVDAAAGLNAGNANFLTAYTPSFTDQASTLTSTTLEIG